MSPPNHGPLFLPYAFHHSVLSIGIVMPIICTFLVAARLYVRRYQKGGIGSDDWLALATLPFIIGMGACLIAGVKLGAMGYPSPPPPAGLTQEDALTYESPQSRHITQIEFAFQHLMFFSYALVKLSIMLFYRRLFVVSWKGWSNVISWTIIGVTIAWFFCFELLFTFGCGAHVDANWGSLAQTEAFCHGHRAFQIEQSMTITDLVLDLAVFVFPFPAIWNLHLTPGRKFAISSVFLVGLMAIVASILRLAYYEQALTHISWTTEGLIDSNLSLTTALFWSYLEAGLALIAACLPSMSYFVTKRSVGSIVASIRSAISLPSIRSQGTQNSKHGSKLVDGTNLPYRKVGDNGSSTSHTGSVPQMVPDSNTQVETHAVYNAGHGTNGHSDVEGDAIYVQKDFSQAESTA